MTKVLKVIGYGGIYSPFIVINFREHKFTTNFLKSLRRLMTQSIKTDMYNLSNFNMVTFKLIIVTLEVLATSYIILSEDIELLSC